MQINGEDDPRNSRSYIKFLAEAPVALTANILSANGSSDLTIIDFQASRKRNDAADHVISVKSRMGGKYNKPCSQIFKKMFCIN